MAGPLHGGRGSAVPVTCEHADPIATWDECFVCAEALRRAFNRLADLDLGPKDVETLMAAIRREAAA